MASGLVEQTRKESRSVSRKKSNSLQNRYQNDYDPFMPLNIKERSEEREGELSTFVLYTNYILNDNISRQSMYLALIFMASFPMFIDAIELFESTESNHFNLNSFCDDQLSCIFTLIACIFTYIAIFILYWAMTRNFYNQRCLKILCVSFLFIGDLLLLSTVLWIASKPNTNPNRTCFIVTNNNNIWCRLSYVGNNCVGVMIGWLAIIDIIFIKYRKFTKDNDNENNSFHLKLRVKISAILLTISSAFIVSNLIINGHFYVHEGKYTNIGIVVCCVGYIMIIIISLFCLLLFDCLEWFIKDKIGNIMSKMLFVAVLCIQTRTFADLFAFSIVCLIMSVDIQVLKEK